MSRDESMATKIASCVQSTLPRKKKSKPNAPDGKRNSFGRTDLQLCSFHRIREIPVGTAVIVHYEVKHIALGTASEHCTWTSHNLVFFGQSATSARMTSDDDGWRKVNEKPANVRNNKRNTASSCGILSHLWRVWEMRTRSLLVGFPRKREWNVCFYPELDRGSVLMSSNGGTSVDGWNKAVVFNRLCQWFIPRRNWALHESIWVFQNK